VRAPRSGKAISARRLTGCPTSSGSRPQRRRQPRAFTPIFAAINGSATTIVYEMFTIGVGMWCLAEVWLVSHHRATGACGTGSLDRPRRL